MIFELVRDFADVLDDMPREHQWYHILKLLNEAIRRDIHFINRHREDYPQALFQCLWNTGWWYDSAEADFHYALTDDKNPLPSRLTDPKLCELLEFWRQRKEQSTPGFVWLRSLRPPPTHLGSPQVNVMRAHESSVNCVAYSPDGQWIASGSSDMTVCIFDAATGEELSRLLGHEDYVNSVAYSADGRRIVSGSSDGTVRVWDAHSSTQFCVLDKWYHRCWERWHVVSEDRRPGEICVAFSHDGSRVVIACRSVIGAGVGDGVEVWDLESYAKIWGLSSGWFGGSFRTIEGPIALSADGWRIVIASGHTCLLLDADNGTVLREWTECFVDPKNYTISREEFYRTVSATFSLDGRQIALGGCEFPTQRRSDLSKDTPSSHFWCPSKLAILDLDHGAEWRKLDLGKHDLRSVSYSPDARRLVTGGGDKTVRIWDASSGSALLELRGHEAAVNSVRYSPDGCRIVSGSADGTVRVWDATGTHTLRNLFGPEDEINTVAFSPDGQWIISTSDRWEGVCVWEADSGMPSYALNAALRLPVSKTALSSDSRRFALTTEGHTCVWDLESRFLSWELRDQGFVTSLAFSPDGRRIAFGFRDGSVRFFNTDRGTEQCSLAEEDFRIQPHEGRRELRPLHEKEVTGLWFSPDGRQVVTSSPDMRAFIWDAYSGKMLRWLDALYIQIDQAAYSPNGQRLVTGNGTGTGTVQMWDTTTGAELHVLQEPANIGFDETPKHVTSVAFFSDGSRVIAACADNTARIWDLDSGKCLDVITTSADASSIAAGWVIPHVQRLETMFTRIQPCETVAWFPAPLGSITTHSTSRRWAGSVDSHLYLITLEGDPGSSSPAASPNRDENPCGQATHSSRQRWWEFWRGKSRAETSK